MVHELRRAWMGDSLRVVNAVLDAPDVPKPDIVGTDLSGVASQIIQRWG